MSILTVQNVHKAYGDRVVLSDVSLAVGADTRLGLLGINGSGKTTLLRILAGVEAPDSGEVTRGRELTVGYLEQEPRFDPGATVRQALDASLRAHASALAAIQEADRALAADPPPDQLDALLRRRAQLEEALERAGGWQVEHHFERMRQMLRLPPDDASVDLLSGGERRRLALARVLLARPDLLLLDEPTNHLDTEAITWLEDLLKGFAGGFVLVTHDRYFLERLVDEIVEVDRCSLFRYRGRYRDYLNQRAARLEAEARAEVNRTRLLRQELAWMQRGPKARTTKQKARIHRAEALMDAEPEALPDPLALRIPDGQRPGKRILELLAVSKGYGGSPLIRDFTLRCKRGDRIGVVGPNGVGKTTLLRLILGEERPDSGEVVVGQRTQLVHASQSRLELDPERTVYESVAENREHVTVGGRSMHVRGYLTRFLFPSRLQETKVGRLSGGERNRLQLARLLRDGGNVILLDEPTNDLDLATLRALEDALVAFAGVVIVVSHDRYLLNRVATCILAFEGEGQVRLYEGDYDFYAARRAEQRRKLAEQQSQSRSARRSAARPAAPQRPRRLTFAERRELEGMEETILLAEEEVGRLSAWLEDPEVYRLHGEQVPAQVAALRSAEAQVEALYARWEELDALRDR